MIIDKVRETKKTWNKKIRGGGFAPALLTPLAKSLVQPVFPPLVNGICA